MNLVKKCLNIFGLQPSSKQTACCRQWYNGAKERSHSAQCVLEYELLQHMCVLACESLSGVGELLFFYSVFFSLYTELIIFYGEKGSYEEGD